MRKLLMAAAFASAGLCGVAAVATEPASQPPLPAIEEPVVAFNAVMAFSCGNYCDNGYGGQVWCTLGFCQTGESCCGQVNCFIGGCSGPLLCCKSNQTCDNGLGYTPPKYPKCNKTVVTTPALPGLPGLD